MYDAVDPFIGTEATRLPAPDGLAATWWWPKPQIGNTHPGATHPFGMVSVCPYSGAYPTGYGRYDFNTEGVPRTVHDEIVASGFTHFQQSGTGAIRKYYNYFRVTPMLEPLDALGTTWPVRDEVARPGFWAGTLGSGIRCELTVGPKSAVHRYIFPASERARVVVDASIGGLALPHSRTVPLRAHLAMLAPGVAEGEITVEGVPLATHVQVHAPGWRQLLWYDRRLMPGGTRLDLDGIRPTTLRPFGMVWSGPSRADQVVEVRMGWSLRGCEQARANHDADLGRRVTAFGWRRRATEDAWRSHLGRVQVEPVSGEQETVLATALYHSLIKPCSAPDEAPGWTGDGPWVFDVCTMWDIYRTQLPLLTLLFPQRATDLAVSLLTVCEEEGNLPIGYRMAKGADRFSRQASALAHLLLADLCERGVSGIDWDWALVHLEADLRRTYGEDYLVHQVAHPISHTLDLAMAYHATAAVARRVGDRALARQLSGLAGGWINAFDPDTGLLVDSTFYEGGRWNYSFRLLHDMRARIELAGGDTPFVAMLDRFFGYGQPPVRQPGVGPTSAELQAGYALGRFEGLNNEPDYDAPWAYHWAGRPDRTAEVVQQVLRSQFGTGRGGLPGNDDSGGLSAWYVWATLGLFPAPGQSLFLLHPPAVPSASLVLEDAELAVHARGLTPPRPGRVDHVQSVTLDGRPLERAWLSAAELREAKELVFTLGREPSGWGRQHRPPSTSDPRPPDPTRR
ncbi:glycoside hydrolase domain-containing protein [Desertihabitans aurantiacus]|uniref:glycoside hydrolase domain-containing protein n=1 Tax=Desertihabitans aurantiacus TaxID=2282477 RepID=UPI000DF76DCA|nr:glycoside hydrolase domain-containing protein [Desertihabitans aurantiacus]